MSDSTSKCWGLNNYGQLGDGTKADKVFPTDVLISAVGGALSGITDLVGVGNHTCTLMENGTAKCWGSNTYGQLGNGTKDPSLFPTDVLESAGGRALSGITDLVGGGNNTCAFMENGTAKCWGWNSSWQIRYAGGDSILNPTVILDNRLITLSGVTNIVAGYSHTCALMKDSTAKCWGQSDYGQIGSGRSGSSTNIVFPSTVLESAEAVL